MLWHFLKLTFQGMQVLEQYAMAIERRIVASVIASLW